MASLTVTVTILGRSKWQWGKGDVVVLRVDDEFFAYCEERDDEDDAKEIEPEVAMDLLTRRDARLTSAGRKWLAEQRALQAKFEIMERKQ